jgi:hypothetical protein
VNAATCRISPKLDKTPGWFSGVGNERVGNARGVCSMIISVGKSVCCHDRFPKSGVSA